MIRTLCFDRRTCHDNTSSARLRNLGFVPWQNFPSASSVVSEVTISATEFGKRPRNQTVLPVLFGTDNTD